MFYTLLLLSTAFQVWFDDLSLLFYLLSYYFFRKLPLRSPPFFPPPFHSLFLGPTEARRWSITNPLPYLQVQADLSPKDFKRRDEEGGWEPVLCNERRARQRGMLWKKRGLWRNVRRVCGGRIAVRKNERLVCEEEIGTPSGERWAKGWWGRITEGDTVCGEMSEVRSGGNLVCEWGLCEGGSLLGSHGLRRNKWKTC